MSGIPWWRLWYWRFRWYVWPRRRYPTRCQYCAAVTGTTMHQWATEDACDVCVPWATETL